MQADQPISKRGLPWTDPSTGSVFSAALYSTECVAVILLLSVNGVVRFLPQFTVLWLALAVLHFMQAQRGLDVTNKIALALGVAFQAWLLLAATGGIPPLPAWSSLGLGLAIIVLCELMAPALSPTLSRRDVYAFYTCPLVMQLFVGRA